MLWLTLLSKCFTIAFISRSVLDIVKDIMQYIKTSYELRSYYVSGYNAISVEIKNGNSAKEIATDIENTFGLMGLTIIDSNADMATLCV